MRRIFPRYDFNFITHCARVIGKAVGELGRGAKPGGVKSYEIISIDLFDMEKVNR